MRNLKALFDYQKFSPNASLQAKIDRVAEQYLSGGVALDDDELMLAAAGDIYQDEPPAEPTDAIC